METQLEIAAQTNTGLSSAVQIKYCGSWNRLRIFSSMFAFNGMGKFFQDHEEEHDMRNFYDDMSTDDKGLLLNKFFALRLHTLARHPISATCEAIPIGVAHAMPLEADHFEYYLCQIPRWHIFSILPGGGIIDSSFNMAVPIPVIDLTQSLYIWRDPKSSLGFDSCTSPPNYAPDGPTIHLSPRGTPPDYFPKGVIPTTTLRTAATRQVSLDEACRQPFLRLAEEGLKLPLASLIRKVVTCGEQGAWKGKFLVYNNLHLRIWNYDDPSMNSHFDLRKQAEFVMAVNDIDEMLNFHKEDEEEVHSSIGPELRVFMKFYGSLS